MAQRAGGEVENTQRGLGRDQQRAGVDPAGGAGPLADLMGAGGAVLAGVQQAGGDVEPVELAAPRVPERALAELAGAVVPGGHAESSQAATMMAALVATASGVSPGA